MKAISESKTVIPVAPAGARTLGQCIGSKITFNVSQANPSGNSVMLQQLTLVDKDKLGKKIRAVIFAADFAHPGHGVDLAPSITEAANIVADIEFATYAQFAACGVSIAKQLAILVASNTERYFYVALVANEALTLATGSPLSLTAHYYID